MGKLEKDERGFWHYTSHSGVIYDVDEASADCNIITDSFQEFWNDDTIFNYKLVDYVYGDLSTDTEGIQKWLDNRIEFYEKYERTIRFVSNLGEQYKCYVGTDARQEWDVAKAISVKEMNAMFKKHNEIDLPVAYVDMIEACLETIRDHNLLELVYGTFPDSVSEMTIKDELQEVLDCFCTPIVEKACDTKIIIEE